MTCESKPPALDVAVCGNGSLFTHTTESPALMVRTAGSNPVASMVTVCVAGLRACAAPMLHASSTSAAIDASEHERFVHIV